ncbi:ATP-binding protein, partial [Candidatus Saccharibacteria bacterium]|nr:ATP-binding protein [Candidatus Saccharibacteria bacterium]
MKYISRQLEETIIKSIGAYPAIMVTGPRQVGKTTLLAHIAEHRRQKINYVSLDDIQLRLQANEDPELFLETHPTPLIIDEFQYAPNLLSYIKIRIDRARNEELLRGGKATGTLYYLTGSQSFNAMKNVSESLAGRVAIFDLFPLSTRELAGLKGGSFVPDVAKLKRREIVPGNLATSIFKKIIIGGYPRLHNTPKISREQYYRDYMNTYVERDIRQLVNIKDENRFTRFVGAVAARTGQEYNANEIANEVGVSNKTVEEWTSILK